MAIVSLDQGKTEADSSKIYLVDDFMEMWQKDELTNIGLNYNSDTQRYCAKISDQFTFSNIVYINNKTDDPSKYMTFDESTKQ
jgi:hypothetical protein